MLNFNPRGMRPQGDRKNFGPTYCLKDGCKSSTNGGKEYCSDHLDHLTYVRTLNETIAKRNAELAALKVRGGALPDDSVLVGEVRALLWEFGSISAPGLSRQLDISHFQARRLLGAAHRHGLCKLSINRRRKLLAQATFDRPQQTQAETPGSDG